GATDDARTLSGSATAAAALMLIPTLNDSAAVTTATAARRLFIRPASGLELGYFTCRLQLVLVLRLVADLQIPAVGIFPMKALERRRLHRPTIARVLTRRKTTLEQLAADRLRIPWLDPPRDMVNDTGDRRPRGLCRPTRIRRIRTGRLGSSLLSSCGARAFP